MGSSTKNRNLAALTESLYQTLGQHKEAALQKEAKANEPISAKSTKDTPEGKTVGAAEENAKTREMAENLKKGFKGGMVSASNDADAQVKKSEEYEHPQEGPKVLTADEAPKQEGDKFHVEHTHKVASTNALANSVLANLQLLAKEASATAAAPQAKEDGRGVQPQQPQDLSGLTEEQMLQKVAEEFSTLSPDEQAFNLFRAGFARGIEKKAEDAQALQAAGIAPDASQANAILTQTAAQNPEAVLPEEATPEGQLSDGDMQGLEGIAQQLQAAGVSAEDFQKAIEAIEQAQAQGASPEEIAQALMAEGSKAQEKQAELTAKRQEGIRAILFGA